MGWGQATTQSISDAQVRAVLLQQTVAEKLWPLTTKEDDEGLTAADILEYYAPGDAQRYQVVGDGVTDDSAAVQRWLDSGEQALFMRAGLNCLVTSELTSSLADRLIYAPNAKLSTNGSILAADYLLVFSGAHSKIIGLQFAGIAATTVCSALQVTGAKSEISSGLFADFDNGFAINVDSAADETIAKDNNINNCAPVPAGAQYGAINCNGDSCLISGNRFIDCEQTAISLNGNDYVTITDNYIKGKTTGVASGGVILDGHNVGCIIRGNTVNGCKVEGIQIAGSVVTYGSPSQDHIIAENILLDCGYSAISLNGDAAGDIQRITVNANHIKSTSDTARAFEFIYLADSTISNNYVYGYNLGISVVSASPRINVVGNTFHYQKTTCLSASGTHWQVTGNRIIGRGSGSTSKGIYLDGVSIAGEILVSGNHITDCVTGITSVFSGTNRSYIDGNFFADNGTDTDYTSANANSSRGNFFDGNAMAGTLTLVAGTVTVTNSRLAAGDLIRLSQKTPGGTPGAVYVSSRTNGSGFVVTSTDAADTSTYDYEIVR